MTTNRHIRSNHSQFFLKREIFENKVAEKIKTHNLYSKKHFFVPKIMPFIRCVEKYCIAGQDSDNDMAHAH
jgi:hypothetical protein